MHRPRPAGRADRRAAAAATGRRGDARSTRTVVDAARWRRRPSTGVDAARSRRGSPTRPRSGRRWCSACATTSARTASASVILGLSGGIDSAVVAAIAVDALGAEQVVRRLDAQRALLAALPRRRGRPGPAHRPALPGRADPADGRRVPGQHGAVRAGRGEPAGPGARGDPDGTVQPGRSPGAHHRQQERAGGRLLHPLRRLGRRLQPAQGRAEDAGVAAGPWRNAEAARRGETPPIPENSITKPPSAELRPGQLDTDSLPDYDGARRDPGRLRRRRPGPRRAARAPATTRPWSTGCCGWSTWPSTSAASPRPGPKISIKAFGRDRRLPITNRFRES